MSIQISHFLIGYFIIFFGSAVIWRNYIVKKTTGAEAFKLNKKVGVEAITSRYFKGLPLVSITVLVLYIAFPETYSQIGVIQSLDTTPVQYAGMTIMTLSLMLIVIAQSQMGSSWRIGIDSENKTDLVLNGIFSFSRNPIFVGIIFSSLGYFLVLPNALTLTILLLDIALIQVQVQLEEQYLKKMHGKNYEIYCQKVRRWL